ncbi:STM3941 family protein [Mesorhizobium loti]|uniref:PH domain-containing protein n=1 Tax=Mesorhizobium loti R88b TaxID=935548 RepID=A0A6M7WMJ1_RHILI|nr:STM3941 family protein [Mesorhizobium loti]QKD00331.1 hypothetical protein EB235_01640 [Mesorhizobium loti R88b]
MPIDVNQTVVFHASAMRLLLLATLALACAAVSLAAGWPLLPNVVPGSLAQFAGWLGTLLFLSAFLLMGWRCLIGKIPVIKLSPVGFWDSRLSAAVVPWSEVENISAWNCRHNKIVVLKISDAAWKGLPLARMARWTRSANQSMGADGLCVSTAEFGVTFDAFFQTVVTHFDAYGASRSKP